MDDGAIIVLVVLAVILVIVIVAASAKKKKLNNTGPSLTRQQHTTSFATDMIITQICFTSTGDGTDSTMVITHFQL